MRRLGVRKLSALVVLILALGMLWSMSASAEDILLAKGKQKGKSSIEVTWQKVNGATSYEVRYTACHTELSGGKTVTVDGSATSCKLTKLKKAKVFKFYVTAYKQSTVLAKSEICHVALKSNSKYTNAKKISLGTTSMTIGVGSSIKVEPTVTKEKAKRKFLGTSHAPRLRYLSSDTSIATISADGTVTAVKEGSCTIYGIAQNGLWSSAQVTVTKEKEKETKVKEEEKVHTLKYVYDFGNYKPAADEDVPEAPDPVEVKVGSTIKKPSNPKYTGFRFDGWTCDYTTMPDKDIVMTGKWVKQVTVTYLLMGASDAPKMEHDENEPYAFSGYYGNFELIGKIVKSFDAGQKISMWKLFDHTPDDIVTYEYEISEGQTESYNEYSYDKQMLRYIKGGFPGSLRVKLQDWFPPQDTLDNPGSETSSLSWSGWMPYMECGTKIPRYLFSSDVDLSYTPLTDEEEDFWNAEVAVDRSFVMVGYMSCYYSDGIQA